MAMQKLRLVGCERFNFKNELYLKGKLYLVGEAKATIMLRKKDEYGRSYFTTYVKPKKSEKQLVAERAAILALKAAAEAAAEEAAIIERPDGSEPADDNDVVEASLEPTEVEVDTDDDPDLDEEDATSPEEVPEDEVEDEVEVVSEDRDDGTAVEV